MDVLRGRRLAQPDEPIFDQGLAFDLESVLINRWHVLGLDICDAVYATSGYEAS